MEMKLYIGNLPFDTTEETIRAIFEPTGKVVSVTLIKERDTGRSKGFGFVEMSTPQEAEAAIKALNGRVLGDRPLSVSLARPREEHVGLPRRDNVGRHNNRGRGKRY